MSNTHKFEISIESTHRIWNPNYKSHFNGNDSICAAQPWCTLNGKWCCPMQICSEIGCECEASIAFSLGIYNEIFIRIFHETRWLIKMSCMQFENNKFASMSLSLARNETRREHASQLVVAFDTECSTWQLLLISNIHLPIIIIIHQTNDSFDGSINGRHRPEMDEFVKHQLVNTWNDLRKTNKSGAFLSVLIKSEHSPIKSKICAMIVVELVYALFRKRTQNKW